MNIHSILTCVANERTPSSSEPAQAGQFTAALYHNRFFVGLGNSSGFIGAIHFLLLSFSFAQGRSIVDK